MKFMAMKSLLLTLGICTPSAAFSPSPSFISTTIRTGTIASNGNSNGRIRSRSRIQTILQSSQDDNNSNNNNKSSIDVMMGNVDIPDEYKEEIFQAEANTPAAKDRATRTAIYTSMALLGIGISSFNAFLTNIRDGVDLTPINDLGFGWVGSNPITSFLFLNKIGGAIALLSAGLGGTMVELEQRTKNENAERIWTELQRRKAQAESGSRSGKRKKTNKRQSKSTGMASNKKMSKKKRNRLNALSEVIADDDKVETTKASTSVSSDETKDVGEKTNANESTTKEEGGLFSKVKDFYEKADNMAASQALLLNKELEDRGVVDKITDETGLKVIGKEEAAKLQNKKED